MKCHKLAVMYAYMELTFGQTSFLDSGVWMWKRLGVLITASLTVKELPQKVFQAMHFDKVKI